MIVAAPGAVRAPSHAKTRTVISRSGATPPVTQDCSETASLSWPREIAIEPKTVSDSHTRTVIYYEILFTLHFIVISVSVRECSKIDRSSAEGVLLV